MKSKELEKLRALSLDELTAKERELKEELFNLRFQNAIGQLRNPHSIGECKRNIARVKTLICELKLKA